MARVLFAMAVLSAITPNAFAESPPGDTSPQAPADTSGAVRAADVNQSQATLAAEAPDLSLEELLDVDVTTASKFAEKQSDAPGIISVLSADDLKRFGGTTLRDVLDRVPGLNESRGYLTDRSTIAARGDQVRLNSGHTLLLINGRPVREAMEGGLSSDMLERFPLDAIDRIEVIKGPGSVLYGSDAFSGVINVITKTVDRTGASVAGMLGSDGQDAAYDGSGTATLKAGDLKVLLSARYLEQPRWRANYLFRVTPTAPIQTLAINGPDKGTGAYLDASYKELRLMAAYADYSYWYHLKGAITSGTWAKTFANLGYSHKLDERWRTDLNVGFTDATLDFYSRNVRPYVQRDSSEFVAEWTNFIDVLENAKLVVGGLFDSRRGKEINHATPATVTTDDARQLGFQAYAQMDYRPWRQIKIIGGIQTNKVGNLDFGVVPRAGLILTPTSRLNFKALYSTAYRAPAIDELFLRDVNLHGDPTLKPETVATFDLGATYQGEQFQVGASYFHSNQSEIIRPALAPGASGTNGLLIYTNTSGVQIQGGEVEAKVYVTKTIYLTGSVLYQKSENDQGQPDVTPIPEVSTKFGASYAGDNGITVSAFDTFEGGVGSTFQNTLNPAPTPHNELNLHGSFDINRLFGLRFQPDVAVQFQVNNLLDDKYFIPEWGGTVHDAIPGSVGRVIYGGLRLAL